jgi:K+ transporter
MTIDEYLVNYLFLIIWTLYLIIFIMYVIDVYRNNREDKKNKKD